MRPRPSPPGPTEPRKALATAGLALYSWDLADDGIAWGPSAADVLGIPHVGVLATGADYAAAVEPQGGIGRAEAIAASGEDRGDGVPYRVRYALRTRADRLVMVEDSGRWFADAEGRPALARGTIRADLDPTPDLSANLRRRGALLASIAEDVAEAQRCGRSLALVVGAFDEQTPDPDLALEEAARRIRPVLRRRDRFMAYGPSRFALALTSCPASDAPGAMRRIGSLLEREPFAGHLRLGAACAPDHASDAPTLLRRAEEALAQAERHALFHPPTATPAPESRPGTCAYAVIDALNGRDLLAVHRPVVDAGSGETAFHALLPGLSGGGPRSHAGDIAATCGRAGLSLLLEARLLELAADHLARHFLDRVSLPISASTLRDPEWLNVLAAHLGARPGISSRLIVDVAESALQDGVVRNRLGAMKALGVAILVSGFGAGHASIGDLRQLPIDLLKIDGALIGNLNRSTEDRLIVHRLVDLAHHLNLGTIAEWVEDDATARLLSGWGVDYLEGPLCGAASAPAEETEPRWAIAG